MLNRRWQHAFAMTALSLSAAALCACGKGNGPEPDPDPDPVATTLSGQISQDAQTGITAEPGTAVRNASLRLLSGNSVVDSVVTDNNGSFEFDGLAAGSYTLRLEVDGDVDLNDDGDNDVVIINLPITIIAETAAVFRTTIIGVDTDLDGRLDSTDVSTLLTDDSGRNIRRLVRLLHRLGKIIVDSDNDGDFDDDDLLDDFDNDGVPDNAQGSLNSLHGGVLKGSIDALSSTSITVRGISFQINSQTKFKLRGNVNADIDDFDVGDNVHIHARWTGEAWVALMIKASGPGNGGGGGGGSGNDSAVFHGEIELLDSSSLSIEGRSFELNSQTDWVIAGNASADIDDFAAGDFVLIVASEDDGVWVATKVGLIRQGDGGPVIQQFSGAITLLGSSSITVGSQAISLNAQTQWKLESGAAGSPSDFGIGDLVIVRARQEGSAWVAISVTMDEDLPTTDIFSGQITVLSATGLTVGGQSISINTQTMWENEDGSAANPLFFQIGDEVRVEAEFSGSAWVATTITLLTDNSSEETFLGLIDSLDGSTLMLHGNLSFTLSAQTQYQNADGSAADPNLFDAGDFVSVTARLQGSVWFAGSIRLLDDEPVIDSFSGLIDAVSGASLSLHGGVEFTVDAETHFMNPDGSDAEASLFDPGDFVVIEARQQGSAWVAMHVTLIDDEAVIDSFTAPIVSISGGLLAIAGSEFVIDLRSHFLNDDGSEADPADFDSGDLVTILARLEGGVWYAIDITLIDDNDTAPVVQVFEGSISALSELSLTVGTDIFAIGTGTLWFDAEGESATLLDFSVSDSVQVIAEQSGLAWTALKVTMQ